LNIGTNTVKTSKLIIQYTLFLTEHLILFNIWAEIGKQKLIWCDSSLFYCKNFI